MPISDADEEELERQLWEIWEYTRTLSLNSVAHSTYGVDQVGKCIDLVHRWLEENHAE